MFRLIYETAIPHHLPPQEGEEAFHQAEGEAIMKAAVEEDTRVEEKMREAVMARLDMEVIQDMEMIQGMEDGKKRDEIQQIRFIHDWTSSHETRG